MDDQKDDRDEEEKDAAARKAEASPGKEAAEDEAHEGDEEGATDQDDDGDEDEAEEEEAKPAAKPAAASGPSATEAGKPGAAKSAPATAKRKAGQPRPAPRQSGSLGKSMAMFALVIGGLGAGFALLGREDTSPPKWNVGQTLDLDVTLVASDARNLACAAPDEIAGKHCAFEAASKPWTKSDTLDDKTLLRPYSTTNGVQFFAAGLWTDAGMTPASVPQDETRFTTHCKYKVEGSIKKAQVRWATGGPWFDWNDTHYTGTLSECRVSK